METIKRNLNYLGLALLAAGLMALRIWPQTKAAGLAKARRLVERTAP